MHAQDFLAEYEFALSLGQSRRCPLCAQAIGDYLIHHIRSTYDYQKHFLTPLRTSPRPLSRTDGARIAPVRRRRERVWGPHERAAQEKADALERAVACRRWIYQHNLYAKVRNPPSVRAAAVKRT
jgi:E3 ubiquitin-protein ligase Topors